MYDNVEGWQNDQFWGRSEFALEFGDYTVHITTPKDHMLGATGVLQNESEVLSRKELKRLAKAKILLINLYLFVHKKKQLRLRKVNLPIPKHGNLKQKMSEIMHLQAQENLFGMLWR